MAFWRLKPGSGKTETACDPRRADYAVFDQVSLKRGDKTVLDGLNLTLSERRIALIGLNGSGKSSFVRLLNGLLLPDSGTLQIYGADTRQARANLPRHVGFVFQNPDHQAIFPTVEEEIAFGLTQLGQPRPEARLHARRFLETHGCAHLAERPFLDLSEGQKQLICILAVLVMQPGLIVFDEPFSSLDGLATRQIMSLIRGLEQKLIMVSHDLELIRDFDRVLWLQDGQIRMDGEPGAVLPAYVDDIERRAAVSGLL